MTVTNPAGHVTTTTLESAWGTPAAVVDANGKRTDAAYDPMGRLLKVWLPGRDRAATPNLEYTYIIRSDGANTVTSKRLGPNGNQIVSYTLYDGRFRPRQIQTPAFGGGRMITDTGYNQRGDTVKTSTLYNNAAPSDSLVGFTDADVPQQHRYSYDTLARPTSDALFSSGTEKWRTSTGYDGDRTWVTPPAGGTPTMTLVDARGRRIELRQYLGASVSGGYQYTQYGYDRLGRQTSVNDHADGATGNVWTWEYDLRGRKMRSVDPDKGTSTSTYDDAGQTVTTTDARGTTLTYSYDNLGRRTGLFNGSTTGTKLAEWTYDTVMKGQPASATRWDNDNAYTTAVTGYDDGYRPTSATVTIPAVEGTLAGSYTTASSYNVDGSLNTQTLPAAGGLPAETITTGYDTATGLPLTIAGSQPYISGTTYTPDGLVSQRDLGAAGHRVRLNTDYYDHNRALRALSAGIENPDGSWNNQLSQSYTYDPAGNVTAIADTTHGTTQAQCFGYDPLRRLTQAWTTTADPCQNTPDTAAIGGPDPYWTSYTYDPTGNRTTETRHAIGSAAQVTRTYTYPATGAAQPHTLTSVATSGAGTDTYTYDNAGNTITRTTAGRTQNLSWDAEGRLASATDADGAKTSYLYDADGTRLLRRDPSATTLYLDSTELRQYNSSTVTGTRYYNGVAVRTTTGLTWLAADHHGTNQLVINANTFTVTRRKTTPFGTPRGTAPTSWPDDHGFVGGPQDTTGLTHLGAREYDPTTGRFVSVDPVVDIGDPQQMNAYAYGNNNPVTTSDANGLRFTYDNDTPDRCCDRTTPWVDTSGGGGHHDWDEPRDSGCRLGCAHRDWENPRPPAKPYDTDPRYAEERERLRVKMTQIWERAPAAETERVEMIKASCAQQAGKAAQYCQEVGPAQYAWCSEFGLDECVQAAVAAAMAKEKADAMFADGTLTIGQRNAFQHGSWMALMVAKYGISEEQALLMGAAHEMDVAHPDWRTGVPFEWGNEESRIDMYNNHLGVQVGRAMRESDRSHGVNVQADVFRWMSSLARCWDCPGLFYTHGH
jgi:RHS repeat-associated protein